jgi:hypothetical protein
MCRRFAERPPTLNAQRTDLEGLDRPAAVGPPSPGQVAVTRRRMWPSERPVKPTTSQDSSVTRRCQPTDRSRLGTGARFLLRRSPTLRVYLLKAAGERCTVAKDNRSGLWGAQERARKAMAHASKVRERAKRAFRVAAARERSADRHDRHAETLEAHGAKRAASAERRAAQLDRDAADAERERQL